MCSSRQGKQNNKKKTKGLCRQKKILFYNQEGKVSTLFSGSYKSAGVNLCRAGRSARSQMLENLKG